MKTNHPIDSHRASASPTTERPSGKVKAVALTRYLPIDDPESLLDMELPAASPGPRDLLVRVEAVSVNPVDTKVRAPRSAVEEHPRVLGWDAAGVVEAVGNEVRLFAPGDAVYYAGDIGRPGTNQAQHLVDERIVGKKPTTLGFAEAAALPLTAITAYEALFDRLGFDPDGGDRGSTVLIVGGAGGVGSIAILLAKVAGLRVVATASREESQSWVRALGADAVIDHRADLRRQLDALAIGEVEAVALFNNTEGHWAALPSLVRPQGGVVSIVETQGPIDLGILKNKSISFAWELMFTRPMYQTEDMIQQHHLLNRVAAWIDAGRIKTTMRQRLAPINASNLREAHALLETGRTTGKIVLEGWG
jgi:zinc-binding alcohol dehydrogenase family protein